MTAVIFVGPTLPHETIESRLETICLPPAAQGDVYRVARTSPTAIGLIDGLFDGVPSVWHKEILWALDQGIPVYGAASMGALRASELHEFGMRGVGGIFEAYLDGTLEDDDDVAVLHGPAETGYMVLSEAMVNVTATLGQATAEGVLDPPNCHALQDIAKGIYYQERTWDAIFAGALAAGHEDRVVAKLSDWLPTGYVDRKRADALALVDVMAAALSADLPCPDRQFSFEYTALWDEVVTAVWETMPSSHGDWGLELPYERILDELRLDPEALTAANNEAFARHLAAAEANRRGISADLEAKRSCLDALRIEHGLATRRELDAWLDENDLEGPALERFLTEEIQMISVAEQVSGNLRDDLLRVLKRRGRYGRLAARAREKMRFLLETVGRDPEPEDLQLAPPELLAWFFHRRLGQPIPDDPGLWARRIGLQTTDDFYRLLRREYLYLHKSAGELDDH